MPALIMSNVKMLAWWRSSGLLLKRAKGRSEWTHLSEKMANEERDNLRWGIPRISMLTHLVADVFQR